MFSRYYDEELRFLREDGKDFSKKYPAARKLFEAGGDPDVERLLEGVAFLCARIRQETDDGFPEISQSLLELIHPHFLRPLPRASILAFEPIPGKLRTSKIIPKHTEVRSVLKGQRVYRFRTCWDLPLHPLTLSALQEDTAHGERVLRLRFQTLPGVKLKDVALDDLSLYVRGVDPPNTYYLFCRHARRVHVCTHDRTAAFHTPCPQPSGFGPHQELFPYPAVSFFGYRLLQEFFAFPQKFLFLTFKGLAPLRDLDEDNFEIVVSFDAPRQSSSRLSVDDLSLHCTPIVNLFKSDSVPIRFDRTKSEYLVQPANGANSEIVAVDGAWGWLAGSTSQRSYRALLAFDSGPAETASGGNYYHLRRRELPTADTEQGDSRPMPTKSAKVFASFVDRDRTSVSELPTELVMFGLTCTDGASDDEPLAGDVTGPSDDSPEFARFNNVAPVSPFVAAPSAASTYWKLISHLSLNHVSLEDVEAFRALLRTYNWEHLRSEQLGLPGERCIRAITDMKCRRDETVVTSGLWPDEPEVLRFGTPIHGRAVTITLQERELSEGELFLFGSVLNAFLASHCSLNTFSRLTCRSKTSEKAYTWPPQLGLQTLL